MWVHPGTTFSCIAVMQTTRAAKVLLMQRPYFAAAFMTDLHSCDCIL